MKGILVSLRSKRKSCKHANGTLTEVVLRSTITTRFEDGAVVDVTESENRNVISTYTCNDCHRRKEFGRNTRVPKWLASILGDSQ